MTSCTAEAAEHKYGNESECSFRRAFSCYFSHSILRHNVIVILWQFSRVAGWLRANSLNNFGARPFPTLAFLPVQIVSSSFHLILLGQGGQRATGLRSTVALEVACS
jgi:hypothetical protein